MLKHYNESSLSTSEVFSGLANLSGIDPKERAIELIKSSKRLTNEDVEAAYVQIKQYSNTLTRAAIKLYDSGLIVLLYNDIPSLSMTQAIPFMTFRTKDGNHVTYVFMDKYVSQNREGFLNIQTTVLHDLLVGAAVANRLKVNYDRLQSSQYLQQLLMTCYQSLFIRVLNREYAINPDKVVVDSVSYYINRFFLSHVFGTWESDDNSHTLAFKTLKNLSEMEIEQLRVNYNNAKPMKLSELLDLVKTCSPRMNSLALGTFLSSWINYYYTPAMLATDTMEYLIFMVLTLMGGNNIISIAASDLIKEIKNIRTIREELLKIVE